MASFQDYMSKAIETQRVRIGLGVEGLARRLGMSRQAYNNHRNGGTTWNLDDFPKLANALELTDEWSLIDLAKNESKLAA